MTSAERLALLLQWYNGEQPIRTPNGFGFIDKEPERGSGIWGYGGDPIAVYVSGKAYPSAQIIELTQELRATVSC